MVKRELVRVWPPRSPPRVKSIWAWPQCLDSPGLPWSCRYPPPLPHLEQPFSLSGLWCAWLERWWCLLPETGRLPCYFCQLIDLKSAKWCWVLMANFFSFFLVCHTFLLQQLLWYPFSFGKWLYNSANGNKNQLFSSKYWSLFSCLVISKYCRCYDLINYNLTVLSYRVLLLVVRAAQSSDLSGTDRSILRLTWSSRLQTNPNPESLLSEKMTSRKWERKKVCFHRFSLSILCQ